MIQKIGFIGTGVMGSSMVKNLLKAGYSVNVYNRTRKKAEDCIRAGAIWFDTVGACVREADAAITMVGYPDDVREVYLAKGGILDSAPRGTYLIDMTTSSPELAVEIADAAAERGLRALDAPCSGGDTGAKNGTLSIMVGGDKSAFDACSDLFTAMGRQIVLQGGPGAGQHTKMCNQIAIAGALSGVCEALAYAEYAGLDANTVLESIGSGAAGSFQMKNLAPKMLAENWEPGFYMKHFVKDLRIARDECEEMGVSLGVLETVLDMCETMVDEGCGNEGTQALRKYYSSPEDDGFGDDAEDAEDSSEAEG